MLRVSENFAISRRNPGTSTRSNASSTEPRDVDNYDRSGMWINAAPEGYQIVGVNTGGAAANVGLKSGEVITAIDGQRAVNSELPLVRLRFRNEPPGTTVVVTVSRNGKLAEVRLVLRDQV